MDNTILDEIKEFARKRLVEAYGYCGVADGPLQAMLNSGGSEEDIMIKSSKD